jgi:hypothetical protein
MTFVPKKLNENAIDYLKWRQPLERLGLTPLW